MTGPLACAVVCALAMPAQASCIAVSFGLDVSISITPDERQDMREGLAAALASPEVADLFGRGVYRIAVWEWSERQSILVDWMDVTGPADLQNVAGAILSAGIPPIAANTATGNAMLFGYEHFAASGCDELRLNIVSDGENNSGPAPHTVRPQIEADWRVQLNGIGIGDGAEYLRNNVILGSGAFVEPATIERFREAVERKLGKELVGL